MQDAFWRLYLIERKSSHHQYFIYKCLCNVKVEDVLMKHNLWKFLTSLKYQDLKIEANDYGNVCARTSLSYVLGDITY